MNAPPSRDPRDHFLTPKEMEDLFTKHIQPLIQARRRVAQPVFMPIIGQMGAGKTALATVLPARLGVVDPYIAEHDDLERLHPSFTALRAAYGEMEAREVVDATESIVPLIGAAMEVGLIGGRNLAFPGPLPYPDQAASLLTRVRNQYRARIHVVAVAAHEAHSLNGGVYRLCREIEQTGGGREINQDWHDFQYSATLRTLRRIEDDGLADAVTCVARDGLPVYHNTLISTGPGVVWRDRPGAAAAVETERLRMWTLAEHADLHRRANAVTEFARSGRLPPHQALAAATALRRGVAVNEPAVALLRERAHYNYEIAAAANDLDTLARTGPINRAAAARRPSAGLGRSTPTSPSRSPRGGAPSIPPGRSTGRGHSPGR